MATEYQWFARVTEKGVGTPRTFVLVCAAIIIWAALGLLFSYNDTWQLSIITATTILTMLIVVLIQNTQAHFASALQIKLDELIRVSERAKNDLMSNESKTSVKLEKAKVAAIKLAEEDRS